jgi:hypothetical protein
VSSTVTSRGACALSPLRMCSDRLLGTGFGSAAHV